MNEPVKDTAVPTGYAESAGGSVIWTLAGRFATVTCAVYSVEPPSLSAILALMSTPGSFTAVQLAEGSELGGPYPAPQSNA